MKKRNFIKTLTAGIALAAAFYPQAWAGVAIPCGEGEGDITSGASANCWQCGDNCYARLDSTGLMTFAGTGNMWEPGVSSLISNLWGSKVQQITSAVIEEGLTSIGRNTFRNSNIERLVIADSVTYLDHYSLEGVSALNTIVIGENSQLSALSSEAFYKTDKQQMNIVCNGSPKGCESAFDFFADNGIGASYSSQTANGRAKYDTNGKLLSSYTNNPDGSTSIYDANGKLTGLKNAKSITPAQAAALVKKGNHNRVTLTFK